MSEIVQCACCGASTLDKHGDGCCPNCGGHIDVVTERLEQQIAALQAELAAARARGDLAQDQLYRLVAALEVHWLAGIDCDHETKTDTARCACSRFAGTPQPSIGAAVRQWLLHVTATVALEGLDALATPPSADAAASLDEKTVRAWTRPQATIDRDVLGRLVGFVRDSAEHDATCELNYGGGVCDCGLHFAIEEGESALAPSAPATAGEGVG